MNQQLFLQAATKQKDLNVLINEVMGDKPCTCFFPADSAILKARIKLTTTKLKAIIASSCFASVAITKNTIPEEGLDLCAADAG